MANESVLSPFQTIEHAQNQSDLIEAGQRRTDVAETATPIEN